MPQLRMLRRSAPCTRAIFSGVRHAGSDKLAATDNDMLVRSFSQPRSTDEHHDVAFRGVVPMTQDAF